jgi:hypothetical protein
VALMPDQRQFQTRQIRDLRAREHPGRPPRVQVNMNVVVEFETGATIKAVIQDLSTGGFRLRSRTLFYVAQRVKLHLPREIVEGELRWVDGFEAGGVFDDLHH